MPLARQLPRCQDPSAPSYPSGSFLKGLHDCREDWARKLQGYSSLSQGAAELMAARLSPGLGWACGWPRASGRPALGPGTAPREPWGQKTALFPPRRQQPEGPRQAEGAAETASDRHRQWKTPSRLGRRSRGSEMWGRGGKRERREESPVQPHGTGGTAN